MLHDVMMFFVFAGFFLLFVSMMVAEPLGLMLAISFLFLAGGIKTHIDAKRWQKEIKQGIYDPREVYRPYGGRSPVVSVINKDQKL